MESNARSNSLVTIILGVLFLGHWLAPPAVGEASVTKNLHVVDKAITFHGGPRFEQSETQLRMCSKSGCYEITSRIEGGRFDLQVEGPVAGARRRARITNDRVEAWQGDTPMDLSQRESQSIRDWVMARVYFIFLPFRLNDDSVWKEDLGSEMWDGRALRKVKVTFVPGSSSGADDEFLYWFEPDTGRLAQFAYSFAGNPGGLRLRRAFNYRRVGGILFFDQENWGLDGPGLTVDDISPGGQTDWQRISTVTVEAIRVSALE